MFVIRLAVAGKGKVNRSETVLGGGTGQYHCHLANSEEGMTSCRVGCTCISVLVAVHDTTGLGLCRLHGRILIMGAPHAHQHLENSAHESVHGR